MNMGEFFDTLSSYGYEDMQRKARMKEAEKAAANEHEWSHFGDPEIMTDDDFVYENEGLADAINARGGKATKDVLLDYFKQFDDSGVYEKDGKVYLPPIEDAGDEFGLEILPENFSAIEEAAKRYAEQNAKPSEEKPKSYAGMSDEELDKSETELLENIFEGKKPEGKTVEKTTVKVEGDIPEEKKAAVAEKVAKKLSKDEVMPDEEFGKLTGKKPGEGGDEKLDNDVEAVMDMVYKLPPEKAKKIMDRLSGLNLGSVPSDKNVKKEC